MDATARRTPPSEFLSRRKNSLGYCLVRAVGNPSLGLTFEFGADAGLDGEIWEAASPRALINLSRQWFISSWKQADRWRRAKCYHRTVCSEWVGTNGANQVDLGDIRCLRGGKKKCIHLTNSSKDCMPFPINHSFAMVMDVG